MRAHTALACGYSMFVADSPSQSGVSPVPRSTLRSAATEDGQPPHSKTSRSFPTGALNSSGRRLQFVGCGTEVSAFEAELLAAPLPETHRVFQTPGTCHRALAAGRAAVTLLHPQLVFSLPGNRQIRELVLNRFSHKSCVHPPPAFRSALRAEGRQQPRPSSAVALLRRMERTGLFRCQTSLSRLFP